MYNSEFKEYKELTKNYEQSSEFWIDFIREAEIRLSKNKVKSNGTADGDLQLGKYCSLRNESFCILKSEWKSLISTPWSGYDSRATGIQYIYPPNIAGWNAAGQECPLKFEKIENFRENLSMVL